jgi:hypothetical protein
VIDDDDSQVKPEIGGDRELLLYDYLKWTTTLSLLTLGGVLSLSQASDLQLNHFKIGTVLIPICVAGVTSLSGVDAIVRARLTGKSSRFRPVTYMRIAVGGLGIGTGAFLSMFWDALA